MSMMAICSANSLSMVRVTVAVAAKTPSEATTVSTCKL